MASNACGVVRKIQWAPSRSRGHQLVLRRFKLRPLSYQVHKNKIEEVVPRSSVAIKKLQAQVVVLSSANRFNFSILIKCLLLSVCVIVYFRECIFSCQTFLKISEEIEIEITFSNECFVIFQSKLQSICLLRVESTNAKKIIQFACKLRAECIVSLKFSCHHSRCARSVRLFMGLFS